MLNFTCNYGAKNNILKTLTHTHTHTDTETHTAKKKAHRLTVEFVDLGQVWEDAGQLIRVQHRPHLLEKDLVQDSQGPQVRRLGGEQLWWQKERTQVMNISERPRDTYDVLLTTNTRYWLLPYMTACLSTSLGLSVASSWGGTVSCQFWPSPTSSSSAAASGSSANGESTLLQGHTHKHS